MASVKEKIGYALGDAAAGGITWKIMSIAFPVFFTNVFGLSFTDTAFLLLIARMFDVFTDPLMGSIADRTVSKWGTYRPWLIFGAIPFGLIFAMLLFTPDFGPVGKRVWAYSFYLLMMAVYTLVNVPYGSLLGVMTADDNEKNEFSSWRMVGAYAMGFITLLSWPMLLNWIEGDTFVALNDQLKDVKTLSGAEFGNEKYTKALNHMKENFAALYDQFASLTNADAVKETAKGIIRNLEQQLVPYNQHGHAVLGAGFGILAAIMTLVCGLLTKETLKPERSEKFSFKQYGDLIKNKPWIYLTSMGICTNFFNGFRYAVAAYMFTYCLNGDQTFMGFIINYTVFMAIGEVTCMIFGALSPKFTAKVGSKRMAFVYSAAICLVFSVLFFLIPMDKDYLWLMILMVILASVGVGLYSPLLWSMYADVADYATEKNGTSSTGLIFSSGTMAQKFGGAISGSLIALLLAWAGLESNDIISVDPQTGKEICENVVTIADGCMDSVKTMIWSLFSLFPALIALIMGWLAYKFPIKK